MEVTASGVLIAINTLPDLRTLSHDIQNLGTVLMKCLPNNFNHKIVSLQEIKVSNIIDLDLKLVENLCNALPNIKNLTLSKCTIITPFYKFSNVTTLNLLYLNNSENVHMLIINIGKKLTQLEIKTDSTKLIEINDYGIDLSIIGYNCVNIEELTILCPMNLKLKNLQYYKLSKNLHFTKLQKFNLVSNHLYDDDLGDFKNVLYVILSSEKLEQFIFPNPNTCLNPIIEELIEIAMVKNGIYSNLKIVDVSSTEILLETVQKLLCVTPKLEKIFLPSDPAILCDVVKDFITRNKLNVKVCRC